MKLTKILMPLCIAFTTCSCSWFGPNNNTSSAPNASDSFPISISYAPDFDEVAFEGLNYLLKKEYVSCKVSIKTTKSGLELNSKYDVAKDGDSWKVSYSKEKYATIDPTKSNPESVIITETGEDVYKENPYSLEKYLCSKDKFDSYFFGRELFEGRLLNGKSFLNSSFNANNFALNIGYSVTINSLEMKYSLDDNTIVLINYLPTY